MRRCRRSRPAWTATASRSSRCAGSGRSSYRSWSGCSPAVRPPGSGAPTCCGGTGCRSASRTRSSTSTPASSSSPLPWLRFVLGFLMTVIIVSGIAAAATHYLYGGVRVQGGAGRTTTSARVHLSVILGRAGAAARRQLLARALRAGHQELQADHRPDLRRRACRAAGQGDPGGGLGDLCRPVLRDHLDRVVAAPRGRCRAAAGLRHRDRPDLPGAGAEPEGPPERADPGAAVHRAQHRGHPSGVRAGRGADPAVQGADDGHVRTAARRRGDHPRHPAARPERGSRTPTASSSRSGSTTPSRTRSTSTATR